MASIFTTGLAVRQRPRLQPSSANRRLVVNAGTALPQQYSKVTPVGDGIFVKVATAETTSVGGLLLPTTAKDEPTRGEVAAAGGDITQVKVGDQVVYSRFGGTEVTVGGTEHVLLKESDVVAVMPTGVYAEMQPLGDRVLIKVLEAEDSTSGGVLLTSTAVAKPNLGEVLAVGPGLPGEDGKDTPVKISVGATVMYSKHAGTSFEDEKSEYIVVREGDVLGSLA